MELRHSLASLWGYSKPTFGCVSEARDRFSEYIPAGRILFVDDAQYRNQYLNQRNRKTGQVGETFEWLRATAETGGFKLVYCGEVMSDRTVCVTVPMTESEVENARQFSAMLAPFPEIAWNYASLIERLLSKENADAVDGAERATSDEAAPSASRLTVALRNLGPLKLEKPA